MGGGVGGLGWGLVGCGGPSHYEVTPTRVEVELRLSWVVTILLLIVNEEDLTILISLYFGCRILSTKI